MPSTTPSKRRKTTRWLTSPIAKISVTLLNALSPLLLLRLTWTGLLEDPTATLIAPLLASLFSIQTTFVVLLLPLLSSAKVSKKRGLVKMDTFGEVMSSKAIPLVQSLSLLLPSTGFFCTFIVLFGAPLTTHIPQTILTALHLSLLASYPLFSSITPASENLRQLITLEYSPDIDVQKWAYWGALGTCIGAWLGAVPIPLDWDRDWQKWPITIIVGAYLGHAVGLVAAMGYVGVSTKGAKSQNQLESIEEEKKVM